MSASDDLKRNLKLVLAYDGAGFHGWQSQPGRRTVQDEVRAVLQRIVRHPVNLLGASRTDAGVHAAGQSANFRTSVLIPLEGLRRAIAHHLPEDLALVSMDEVSLDFHASRSARTKLYRYRIFAGEARPSTQRVQLYAWHVWQPLDLTAIVDAARRRVGTHDFAGFASSGSPRKTTVRTVRRVQARWSGRELLIDVEGDGFLYNQVRNMVGTLYEIGRGRWEPQQVDQILASGDRRLAGMTAPAHGLCLQWVRYAATREAGKCN